jgi:nucleotide-binding universal stress UspA family protein
MSPRRILVPVDLAPRGRQALRYAIDLARREGASIDVLHVVPAPPALLVAVDAYLGMHLPQVSGRSFERALERVEALITSVPTDGVTVRARAEAGDPAATIVRLVAEEPIDLIVMATHARTGLSEMVLGSVAHRVVSCAACPVLMLRGDESRLRSSDDASDASLRR